MRVIALSLFHHSDQTKQICIKNENAINFLFLLRLNLAKTLGFTHYLLALVNIILCNFKDIIRKYYTNMTGSFDATVYGYLFRYVTERVLILKSELC